MLENLNNYYIYTELVKNQKMTIYTDTINIENWRNHYDGILNIMKDGIETDYVQNMFITVDFGNGDLVDLSVTDYFFNIILWYSIIATGNEKIKPWHLVFAKHTNSGHIKKFIDTFFITERRENLDNVVMNNIIADCLYNFLDVDDFSFFIANTLNLEDTIEMMDACPEYDALIHKDYSNIPLEEVKDRGLEAADRAIELLMDSKKIMGHEHCLRNPFAAKEGINKRQWKENSFNIGTKPDGHGSILHDIINTSYITGGLDNPLYFYIDAYSARNAQIIAKKNVGTSGGFSRILGLNNIDTFLNPDMEYDCHTNNLAHIFIRDKEVLDHFIDRYARMELNGFEFLITKECTNLVGKWIYLRTPAMCKSFAMGKGICRHCYGELARTNRDINVGRIATEIITSQYTQMRLSAKHLLETVIKAINWVLDFYKFFRVDTNVILLNDESFPTPESLKGWSIIIKGEDVQLENDGDFFKHIFYSNGQFDTRDETSQLYNEYITDLIIKDPNGDEHPISSVIDEETGDDAKARMYISNDFANIIRDKIKDSPDEEENLSESVLEIPLMELQDMELFYLKMMNNDLGKALDIFTDLINKKDITKQYNIDEMIMKLVDAVIRGKIHCRSVHLEVILANQIRSIYDRFEMPDWSRYNEQYEVLTLKEALTHNRSVIVSFKYQDIARALYNPITYKKTKTSCFDPFYMHKPIKFMNIDHEVWDKTDEKAVPKGTSPIMWVVPGHPEIKDNQAFTDALRPKGYEKHRLDE